jgi:hypothetical protein
MRTMSSIVLRQGMPFAKSQRRSGQRHINGFGSQGSIARCLCQGTLAFVEQRFKTRARFIDELPDAGPLFGRDRTHAAQQAGKFAFLTQQRETRFFDLRQRRCGIDLRRGALFQLAYLLFHKRYRDLSAF